MDGLNTLRAILVAGTFVVAVLLAFDGQWVPAAVLGAGILAHFALWAHLWRQRRDRREHADTVGGMLPPQA